MATDNRPIFGAPRFATRGVVHRLDPMMQVHLWQMVDTLCQQHPVKPDYLQVFDLTPIDPPAPDGCNQSITHRQEQPQYQTTNEISVETPVTAKIFVIDDGSHCTMLFANEY